MHFRGEAVAENTSFYQKLAFFSALLWHDLWTWISVVHCASYDTVAPIRMELLECKVFDKKKEKEQFTILILVSFIPY